jgi:PAS domain S-box-containing protein
MRRNAPDYETLLDFFENATDMFCLIDINDQEVLFCNNKMATHLGYASVDEMPELPFNSFVHEDFQETFREALQHSTTSPATDCHLVLLTGKRELRHVIVNISSISSEKSSTVSRLIFRVPSNQDRIQEIFQQSAILSCVIESMSDGVIVADSDGEFLLWNKSGEEIVGIGETEADTSTWSETYGLFETDRETPLLTDELPLVKAINGTPTRNIEMFVRNSDRPDGAFIVVNGDPLRNEQGDIIGGVVVIEDITERRALTEELELERSLALHASKMATLGEMAGGVAHEINNPLQIIQGSADALGYAIPQDVQGFEAISELIQSISNAVGRSKVITDSLRRLSRSSENDPMLPVAVSRLINETLTYCQRRFYSKGVDLTVENTLEQQRVTCREIEITQVLLNLLNNAFDAVSQTESEKSWVSIATEIVGGDVVFHVTDSGPGVPEKSAETVFYPFFTTKGPAEGTGLGLSISKTIVDAHKGEIWLEQSHPNTRFSVKLPLDHPEQSS